MAFGATLTLTVNSVAKVLNRINDQDYGSEYYLRNAGVEEYRVTIRHSKESPLSDGKRMDRHLVTIIHTVFGVSPALDVQRIVTFTIRCKENDDLTAFGYLFAAAVDYVDNATVQGDLLTWQS